MACATASADIVDWHRSHFHAGRCQLAPSGAQCAHEVHTVRCGDGIVRLDLRSASYSCEYDPLTPAQPAIASENIDNIEPIAAATGLSFQGAAYLYAPLEVADIVCFIGAVARSFLRFPGRSLVTLVASAPTRSRRCCSQDPADVFVLAAKFNRMSIFLPFRPACLLGSFLMRDFLRLRGADADWVFGVQLFPFRAHCWLEADAHPLNDRLDNLAFYAPILRVPRAGE